MKQEMTFSGEVKEELSKHMSSARHCQIAEIAAITSMCGKVSISSREQYSLKIRTENISVARKYFTLLRKTFNIDTEILITRNKSTGNISYTVIVKKHKDAIQVLMASRLMDDSGEIVKEEIVQRNCCKRAYLRGAFLAGGSVSNPEKSYHIEIVCGDREKAEQLQKIMIEFQLDAKVILRKKSFVVYIKEGAQIVDLLRVIKAPIALMKMENVRILKEVRNSVNRKVNCETANLNKTASAAAKQIEDISYIQKKIGFAKIPEGLQEIARLRLEYPEASLQELADLSTDSIGKSGINHRLRKLSEIAEDIRKNREE